MRLHRSLFATLSLEVVVATVASLSVALASCSSQSPAAAAPTAPADDGGTPPTTTKGPLALAAGEVGEVTFADDTATARFTTTGGEKMVVVLASTKLDGTSSTFAYSASASADGDDTGVRLVDDCALAPWTAAMPAADPEPSGAGPKVGDTRSIVVSAGVTHETITAKAAAVGERAIVWVDTTAAHPATMEDAFIADFLSDFEKVILPRERAVFGMESDQDGDGRISLVFTPLTKESAVAFFLGCDLAELDGCKPGNHGEYLYLTPPADIEPPYNTPAAIKETLAQELGHLVHFNRKVLRNKLTAWPDSAYMIEGFGAFAQDVIGYQAGNLYVAKAGLDQIDDFSIGDVFGQRDAYDQKRDGLLRGGAYWLVRFLYDRAGGDTMKADGTIDGKGGPAAMHAWLDAPSSVTDGVTGRAAPRPLADVTLDFYTALAASGGSATAGLSEPKNACFAFAKTNTDPLTTRQRGGDPRASFHGQAMTGPAMKPLASADKKLRAGGVDYLTVDVPAGQTELGLTVKVDPKAAARIRVIRVK